MLLNDLLAQVPTGHNDFWAGENVKVRVSCMKLPLAIVITIIVIIY